MKLSDRKIVLFSARTRDHARFALLVMVAIEVFVLPSLVSAGFLTPFHMGIAGILTLFAGVVAVGERLSIAIVTSSLAVMTLIAEIIARHSSALSAQVVLSLLTMLVLLVFAGLILAYVFGKERSMAHRMVGAVAVYLLIAVAWARAYHVLWLLRPGMLDLGGRGDDPGTLLYFSFATLTTLGFGTPVGPFARAMVSMEALVGQLYPAILIARLVSLPGPIKPESRSS